MPEITTIVRHKLGLHARPAAQLVHVAQMFSSDISIVVDGQEASAKSILKVLSLGVCQGTPVVIRAEGEDAAQALAALAALIESNFGEGP
jgi:phosphotransferase system HPr (HPr) family protein